MTGDPLADDLSQKQATASADPLAVDLRRKQKLADIEAKIAADKAEPDPMSFGEIVKGTASETGSRLWGGLKNIGSGVATLAGAVRHPIETVTTPEKRRELERGVSDIVTLGYGQKLADKISSALPESMQHGIGDKQPTTLAATEEGDASAAPGYRGAGNLVGAMVPNPIGKLTGGVGKLIGPGASAAGNVVRGVGRGALQYEATAPVAAGLSAGASGDRMGAALNAATDPAGLALAAGASAVPAATGEARKALRDPRREMGRTIQGLEEGKQRGIIGSPEFKALPKGAEGFNEAATQAEERLGAHQESTLKQARADYGRDQAAILADHGDTYHLVTKTAGLLDSLEQENQVNGEVVDESLGKAIEKTRRMLSKPEPMTPETVRAALAKGIAPEDMQPTTTPAVKVTDLIKVKRAVDNLAEHGDRSTPDNRPYRMISKTMSSELEDIDPRLTDLNSRYHGQMDQLEQANDILYGQQNPAAVRSTAAQKRARGLLGRVGDSTQAATLARKDISRLKELDPAYGDIVAPVEAKKAYERSRFGLPHVSRRFEHQGLGMLLQNGQALGARVADPALGALSNGNGGGAATGTALLLNAAKEQERRDAESAARLIRGARSETP